MNEYLQSLACIQNSTLTIVDYERQTLNKCFLDTYVQVPAYLAFAVANAYSLASSAQMPRLFKHGTLTLLRLLSLLILLVILGDMFVKYFTSIYPEWHVDEALFSTQLVLEFYQLATFTLNVFLLFNRNVFRHVFPLGVFVCLFALVAANLVDYINRVYAESKTFNDMVLFERIEILRLTFFNFLLVSYLFTVLLGFKFESMRVLELDTPPESLLKRNPEEDEASYYSYLSFRYIWNNTFSRVSRNLILTLTFLNGILKAEKHLINLFL